MQNKTAVFPKIGDYSVPLNLLIEQTLGWKTMECPSITKKTVEVGAKHSPDTVCTPFKVIIGNFIEAFKQGANVVIMPAVGCRLGFYDILHDQILHDLEYQFETVTLFDYAPSVKRMFDSLSKQNPDLTRERFDEVFAVVCRIVIDMDEISDYMRRNMAFQIQKGEIEKLYKQYLTNAKTLTNIGEAEELGKKYKDLVHAVKLNKPEKPLRIGLVGDLYSVIEPHGNCEIEKWLSKHNAEIVRPTDLTYLAKYLIDIPTLISWSGGYANYNIGGNANGTVAHAYQMCKNGTVDGIIHMKAATCTPEITAMSILQNISNDFGIPIIYLTFDTVTGEAGLHTRLEAFIDMLNMRKGKH